MILRFIGILSMLCLGFSASADPLSNARTENLLNQKENQDKLVPGMSVMLYLSPANSDSSFFTGAPQLTVTPTTNYTVRAIKITNYGSSNGTCTNAGGGSGSHIIDNGAGVTVTLSSGHNYVTTDASNFIFSQLQFGTSFVTRDNSYELFDNTLSLIGSSGCIQASPSLTCTALISCGWNSARTWTP